MSKKIKSLSNQAFQKAQSLQPSLSNIYKAGDRHQEMPNIPQILKVIKQTQKAHSSAPTVDQCLFVFGLTGSGKSTLISYACGAKMSYSKQGMKYRITHQSEDLPIIGNSLASCTSIPQLYRTSTNLNFYDFPGYFDTKGTQQQIINAYSTAKIFRSGLQAKFVLVVELSSLQSAKGGGLVQVIHRFIELFKPLFNQIVKSCALVITKVPGMHSREDVVEGIQEILENNQNIGIEGKALLKTMIDFEKVQIMPVPQYINSDVINNLISCFEKLKKNTIRQPANIYLSSEAKLCLNHVFAKLQRDGADIWHLICLEIQLKFKRQAYTRSDVEILNKKIWEAKENIDSFMLSTSEKYDQMQRLFQIRPESICLLKQWLSQVTFCLMVSSELMQPENYFIKLEETFQEIRAQLEDDMQKISQKEELVSSHQAVEYQLKELKEKVWKLELNLKDREQRLENAQKLRREKEVQMQEIRNQMNCQKQESQRIFRSLIEQL